MRKLILLSFASFLYFESAKAQSLTVLTEDTLLQDPNTNVLLEAHADIQNNTTGPIRTLVSREEIVIAPEHVNYFCWGVTCYAPTTIVSPDTITVNPNELNGTFKGYIDPGGLEGNSTIRYCFINALNPADKACFVVKYRFGPTSVGAPKEPGQTVKVPASYDPGSQTIKVNVNGGKIEILNMLGQKVELNFRYDGTGMEADATSLKTGYYFLFGSNEKGPWSARVIVTK
ncbi:MAG TPA: hypothetical protein PLK63_08780 [Catalimonadaceae bacterium]|nr:hypothetical protein [Catalimonadaceae bacterium]